MAEVAVNYMIERLSVLFHEDLKLIRGVEEVIDDLVGDLLDMKAFIRDASKIDSNTPSWKVALREIRDVVYEAEDVVDKFLIDLKKHQGLTGSEKFFDVKYIMCCRKIPSDIMAIRCKANELYDKYEDITEAAPPENQPNIAPNGSKQNIGEEDDVVGFKEDDVVGFDEEAKTLIDRLIGGSKDLEAVPILGEPGLGKSTLAMKVYKDSRITTEFFDCIWVNVSETYRKEDILFNLLTSLKKQAHALENMSEEQITHDIRTSLEKGARCLIVLDDVWERDVLDFIRPIFPKNNKSHRIMVTTRITDVASYFNANIHQLKLLDADESWLLLKKKVFRTESCSSNELEELRKVIATKCVGQPLSIVVIAGALAGNMTRKERELMAQTMGNRLQQIEDSSYEIVHESVEMSYKLLSYYKKVCFVYCATFPRGFDIPACKLIRLWIAESFIPHEENVTLEETAEDCLNDLIKRNLVMVVTRKSDGVKIKTCRVQNVLYEFCRDKAFEDDLFKRIMPEKNRSSVMIQDFDRHICIDSSKLYNFLSSEIPSMEHVRSFLCFGPKQMDMYPSNMVRKLHKAFPLIRILDVGSMKFTFSGDFFQQLYNLKYVSISGDFKDLPHVFDKFWNLETIILNVTTPNSTLEIKANIWSMPRLRHLYTNVPAKLSSQRVAPASKKCCVQTLSLISSESCTKKVFARARYIQKLGIRGNVVALNTKTGLAKLEKLENLKLVNDVLDTDKVITPPKLVFKFPKNLRKLTISATHLEWSEMSKLGQLESLEVLKLKEDAFKGDLWETENGGFSSLLVLLIDRTDLKIWKASTGNFPSLKRLVLMSCENLEAVPESLADISSLQFMKLENTAKAVKSARIVEEKKLKCQTSFGIRFKLVLVRNQHSDT